MSMEQGVVLGGEQAGRSILGGRRAGWEWGGIAMFAVAGLVVAFAGRAQLVAIVSGTVVLSMGWVLFTPWDSAGGERSLWSRLWDRLHHLWRARTGRAVFLPAWADELDPTSKKQARGPDVPDAIGRVRTVNLTFDNGSQIAVLLHENPGSPSFFTVTFEMQGGVGGGITDAGEEWRSHFGFASLASALARHGSLIRGLQQVARVVPFDTADHELWLIDRSPTPVARELEPDEAEQVLAAAATAKGGTLTAGEARAAVREAGISTADRLLAESYVQLLDDIPVSCEQHRTWLTVRMPRSTEWSRRARTLGAGMTGDRLLAMEQVRTVVKRAADVGLALRPLSEARLAGVVRSLQDPLEPIDLPIAGGLGEAFLPLNDSDRRYVEVTGSDGRRWLTRTAYVTSDGLSGAVTPPDFLRPLLTSVEPSVIRTISSSIMLSPASSARTRARKDASRDQATVAGNKRLSDGSQEVQAAGSQVRLEDLRPGSNIHGASWTLAITYTAESEQDLQSADDSIAAAADASGISRLKYLDGDQQAAHMITMPLGRGIREDARWAF